ncbi:type VII secretion target [Actinomadura formosensis]|uniref:type VII secretion target n=1 Tax=Actinomadura formosensis TaxID=60706 RepID=UPI00082E0DE5|nr:type VII secretion target [Actinomadura formosensis]
MSFRVEPGALETFAQSLGVLAGDAKKAKGYVQGNQKAVDSERGLLFGYVYALGVLRIGDAVQKNVERLDALTVSSGKELHKCAEVYRATEKKIAEKIDRTYPKK